MRKVIGFPNPVNEVSARVVATGVVTQVALLLALTAAGQDWARWLLVPLAYGFWARVLTGPTLSPLGRLATQVVTPRLGLEPRLTPGPPKRFAQGIGTVVSTAALVAWVGFGSAGVAVGLLAILLAAASLEAFANFCLGCWIFGRLMRLGVIPEDVCEACNDLSLRIPALQADRTAEQAA